MQDSTALTTADNIMYATVMGYTTGYHASEGDFYSGSKVALYLGANCGDAVGGLKYEGNILVVLEYE